MNRILLPIIFAFTITLPTMAAERSFEKNKIYMGAEAAKSNYQAIYQLDSSNPKIIKKAFRNINHLLEDRRLKDKIQVEIIAFSGGTEALLKSGEHEEALRDLVSKGVIVAQCLNSLKERNLDKSHFFDFIAFVPSGNGELVLRGAEGWVIIKP